jgi:hypothetical protein
VGSEEGGGECGAVSGRGGVVGAVAAHAGGGGSARSGFRRKKKVGLADRVGPPISEGEAAGQAGPVGKGGRWAVVMLERSGAWWAMTGPKSLLGLKSKEVKENQFLIDFWIKIGLEIEYRDFGGRNILGKNSQKNCKKFGKARMWT